MSPSELTIRTAAPDDTPLLLEFIRAIAEYERLAHEVVATEEGLREALFGPQPVAEAVLGFWNGDPAAFAIFFHNFSTFVGRRGLYLEDLFVKPEFRGRGIGRALFHFLAKLAQERNCGRFEWSVLDWNRPAIEFYTRAGAVPMSDWTVFRLSGEGLRQLAAQ